MCSTELRNMQMSTTYYCGNSFQRKLQQRRAADHNSGSNRNPQSMQVAFAADNVVVHRISEESTYKCKITPDTTLCEPLEFYLLCNVAKTWLLLVLCIHCHGQLVERVLGYPLIGRRVIHHIEDVMCGSAVCLKVLLVFHLFRVESRCTSHEAPLIVRRQSCSCNAAVSDMRIQKVKTSLQVAKFCQVAKP